MSTQCNCEVRAYLTRYQEILEKMIRRMSCAELTDSISHNFIRQMIPHHEAAIEMSRNVLRFHPGNQVRSIACGIIEEQTKSIAAMEQVLSCCSQSKNCRQALCSYQNRFRDISQKMFAEMSSACADSDISANFLREMIPHHEGAVRMCCNMQNFPVCEQLIPITNRIIVTQKEGIRQMKCLLNHGI